MIVIQIADYPRFRAALIEARRKFDPLHNTYLGSGAFRQLMKDAFELDAWARPGDPMGQFYIKEEDATMFMLKWS